jgi:ABC-type multidrug transport system fused ATPase/permease subunit
MRIRTALTQKLQPLRLLLKALTPRRRRQLLGLQLLSLLAAAGEVANLGALLPFLRLLANPQEGLRVLGPMAEPLRRLPEQHLLLSLGLAFMLVVVASSLLRAVTIQSQLRLAALIAADLGDLVFAAALVRPLAWHLRHNSSTVLSHLTKDVDQAYASIQAVLILLVNLAIVILLGGALIALAPLLMLLIGGLLSGLYLLVFRFTKSSLRSDGERYTRSYQASLQVAQEGLGGIRDVLLDHSQSFFLQAFRTRNLAYRMAGAAINVKAQVPRFLIEGFAVILIVGLSLSLAISGKGIEQQLPMLGAVALGAYRLLQPLQQCFAALSSYQANQVSLLLLKPFLEGTSHTSSVSKPVLTDHTKGNPQAPLLWLSQVSFRYFPNGPWVLKDLELAIQTGERLAFVGSTGSGKSTTTDLILGLLAPTMGQVLVEGVDLHSTFGMLDKWQQHVAHVPQHIYLSDASFAANIAFGVPQKEIDFQRVRLAAVQARIVELIEGSPEGYDTVVGERGVKLSGGQRQRIGIARALYKKAQLLVLDEATSALDNRTEADVMESIEGLDRDLTVVLVAHRLSTVRACDRLVFLEHGRISAIGNYDELISSHSTFSSFAK